VLEWGSRALRPRRASCAASEVPVVHARRRCLIDHLERLREILADAGFGAARIDVEDEALLAIEGGRDLGEAQVAAGHAAVYVFERPFRRLAPYERAERQARARGAGAWGACGGDFHRPS
jgi:endonuclease YncB( thermonuclease family)